MEETAYSGDWLPLRELSEILPYSVEWKDRTVYVYADRTWEIKPDRWIPDGVSILDALSSRPYMEVAALIRKIVEQSAEMDGK